MTSHLRIAVLTVASLLSGCADNCNILSSSQSFGCQVALGGGFLLAAPFVLPVEAAKRAAQEAEENKDYLTLKAGVTSSDLESLKRCVLHCNNFLVFMDEKHQLRKEAARKIVALDGPELAQEQIGTMMVAYWLLAWNKSMTGTWQLDNKSVGRGWALALRYHPADSLDSTHERTLSDLARYVFILHLLSLPDSDRQTALEDCVVQNHLPMHPLQQHRDLMCSGAYETYARITNSAERSPKVPKYLEDRWWAENNAKQNARTAKP